MIGFYQITLAHSVPFTAKPAPSTYTPKKLDISAKNHDIRAPEFTRTAFRGITLANTPQARKRARQNVTRNVRNRSYRSSIRTNIKTLLKAITEKDTDAAVAAQKKAASAIDKGCGKGLMHKNNAARLKSRLNKRVQALAG